MKEFTSAFKKFSLKLGKAITGFLSVIAISQPAGAVSIQFAPADDVLTRTTNLLWVWSQPCGGTNLAKLSNNVGGQILQEKPTIMSCFGGTYTWYKVKFSNTLTGWVAGDFLVNNYNKLQSGGVGQVRTTPNSKLWVWSQPCGGTNLTQLPEGAKAIITTKGPVATCFGGTWNWYKVEYSSGRQGWVAGEYLQAIPLPWL